MCVKVDVEEEEEEGDEWEATGDLTVCLGGECTGGDGLQKGGVRET